MNAEELITQYLEGVPIEELFEELPRRSDRPKKRRFSKLGKAFNAITGKKKDPHKRLKARKAARKSRAKRKASARKFNISAKGKLFHKKLGRLVARIRRPHGS